MDIDRSWSTHAGERSNVVGPRYSSLRENARDVIHRRAAVCRKMSWAI
jgi:hypothetical protein